MVTNPSKSSFANSSHTLRAGSGTRSKQWLYELYIILFYATSISLYETWWIFLSLLWVVIEKGATEEDDGDLSWLLYSSSYLNVGGNYDGCSLIYWSDEDTAPISNPGMFPTVSARFELDFLPDIIPRLYCAFSTLSCYYLSLESLALELICVGSFSSEEVSINYPSTSISFFYRVFLSNFRMDLWSCLST